MRFKLFQVPIPALCSSDEESDDKSALVYLPIAPEVGKYIDRYVVMM